MLMGCCTSSSYGVNNIKMHWLVKYLEDTHGQKHYHHSAFNVNTMCNVNLMVNYKIALVLAIFHSG